MYDWKQKMIHFIFNSLSFSAPKDGTLLRLVTPPRHNVPPPQENLPRMDGNGKNEGTKRIVPPQPGAA
jgi:hypothetical protein